MERIKNYTTVRIKCIYKKKETNEEHKWSSLIRLEEQDGVKKFEGIIEDKTDGEITERYVRGFKEEGYIYLSIFSGELKSIDYELIKDHKTNKYTGYWAKTNWQENTFALKGEAFAVLEKVNQMEDRRKIANLSRKLAIWRKLFNYSFNKLDEENKSLIPNDVDELKEYQKKINFKPKRNN